MGFWFYRSPAPSGQEGAVYNTDASFVSLYYFNNTISSFAANVKGMGEYSEFLKNKQESKIPHRIVNKAS